MKINMIGKEERREWLIALLISMALTSSDVWCAAQSVVDDVKAYEEVEEKPEFPGGIPSMFNYLSKNLKYPVVAEENGIQGRVILTCVIERDGTISNVKVVKSIDPSLDKEALHLVRAMPHWTPGKHNGSVVRVRCTIPVTFKLQ